MFDHQDRVEVDKVSNVQKAVKFLFAGGGRGHLQQSYHSVDQFHAVAGLLFEIICQVLHYFVLREVAHPLEVFHVFCFL